MKKVMLLVPALLLAGLSGCGESNSSNISDSNSSDNSSNVSSDSSSVTTTGEWSNDIKTIMNEYLKVVLPYHQFDEATFDYDIDAENGVITLYDELLTNHISSYKDVLVSNGWVIDGEYEITAYSEYDEDSEGNLTNITGEFTFYEVDLTNESNGVVVACCFSEKDGIYDGNDGYYYEISKGNQFVAFINSSNMGELTSWPDTLISEYFDGAVVPAVEGIEEYYVDDSNLEEYGLVITFESSDSTLEASYKQTLLDANFTVEYDSEWDGDIATDSDNKVNVGYYLADDGYFYIQIFDSSSSGSDVEYITSWPSEEITSIFNVDIPSYEASKYSVIDLSSMGYGYFIYCYDVSENASEEYKTILESNEYTVTYSETDGYIATDKDNLVEITFYNENTDLIISINEVVEPVSWPTELISSYFDGAVVPAVEGVSEYFIDDSNLEEYGLIISFDTDDETLETSYKQTLLNANFTFEYDSDWDGELATDSEEKVEVGWYLYNGTFYIQIFENLEIEENVLDFSSEDLLTSSSSEQAIWENGNYKMIVTKATSSTNVGNTTYLSNPLRLYNGQHVELSWSSESVSTIEINLSSQNNKSDLGTISNVVGGTISINGNVATISVSEGASKVEFDIVISGNYKQCHISSIVFNA